MPEPISSSSTHPASDAPTLDEPGQVCRAPDPPAAAPTSSAPPPSVAKLVSSVPPPPSALPPSASTAQNNAQRTSERSGIGPYAEAGVTGDAADSVYAGAAALKGRDPETGLEVEVFSASVQVGGENEVQAGMARVGISGKNGSATLELLTARAAGGAHNDDGSLGANTGAGFAIASAEGTLNLTESASITVGAGLTGGAGVSVGVRDIDKDGVAEKCVKVSAPMLTFGICVED
jgi:hypothetical protein